MTQDTTSAPRVVRATTMPADAPDVAVARGAVAYALVRERKPQRIVEVGSGHSTRILARAECGVGEIVAIDPMPRTDIVGLPGVRVVPSTLQAAPAEVFDGLKAGDVLFIDSSHILMPGSDVDILLNRVLPRLPRPPAMASSTRAASSRSKARPRRAPSSARSKASSAPARRKACPISAPTSR